MELICLGDSLTFGYGIPYPLRWTTLFQQKSGWRTANRGVCGDTAAGMLARLERDVLTPARRPGAGPCRVLVMGGSNDIFLSGDDQTARSGLTELCRRLEDAGLPPLVGIPLPVDWRYAAPQWEQAADLPAASARMEDYQSWVRQLCAKRGLTPVDFARDFLQGERTPRHDLFLDGIHPNALGHQAMSSRLYFSLFP